ncbi:MAG: hypothetical protein ROO71_02875 [Balneola sp.]
MRIIFCILIIVAVSNSKLRACSCGTLPFEEAVERSAEIFIGTVVKIELERDLFPSQVSESLPMMRKQFWVVTLEVSKKWKGSKKSKILVKQTFNSCEFPFEFGGEYLVYAERGDLRWNASRNHWNWLCSRTINTYYFNEWVKENSSIEGWDFDDRERLDQEFPNSINTSSFFNNWPAWIVVIFGCSILLFHYLRKKKTNNFLPSHINLPSKGDDQADGSRLDPRDGF